MIGGGLVIFLLVSVGIWFARTFRDELRDIARLSWLIWCWLYAIRWRIRFGLRTALGKTAAGIVLAGSGYVVLETLVAVARHSSHYPSIAEQLNIPELPLWSEAVLVILAILLLRNHFKEWRASSREARIAPGIEKALDVALPELRKATLTEAELETLCTSVLREVVEILQVGRGREEIVATIVVRKADNSAMLQTRFVYPVGTPRVDKAVELEIANSASGKCMAIQTSIYVPSTRHLGGINMKTYRSAGLVYAAIPTEPGRCLICVPIFSNTVVTAVLNVTSTKTNAFQPEDAGIAGLGAKILSDRL